jgi:hypothetical protein
MQLSDLSDRSRPDLGGTTDDLVIEMNADRTESFGDCPNDYRSGEPRRRLGRNAAIYRRLAAHYVWDFRATPRD